MAHWKKDCWYNVPVDGKGKSKGKGKQKSTPTWVPKGKGKGASGERKCWNCGETGHMSSECKKPKKAVNSLAGQSSTQEPESHDALGGLSLASVGKNFEHVKKDDTKISFGIDSGAAATTLPKDWCTDYPLEKVGIGKGYYSASGEAIPDLGRRRLVVTTAVRARVTKVRRALIRGYDMRLTGHQVVFDMEDGVDMSYVLHKKTARRSSRCCGAGPGTWTWRLCLARSRRECWRRSRRRAVDSLLLFSGRPRGRKTGSTSR